MRAVALCPVRALAAISACRRSKSTGPMIPGQTASTSSGPSGLGTDRIPMYAGFLSICWTVENLNSPPVCVFPRRDVNVVGALRRLLALELRRRHEDRHAIASGMAPGSESTPREIGN